MSQSPATLERQVQLFQTAGGGQIFQIPLLAFPGLWGYAYLVLVEDPLLGEMRVLLDCGSGYGDSNQHLEAGFAAAGELAGRKLDFADLTHILLTHAHIDHFGGLNFVRRRSPQARLGVHELDRRVLTNYEERLTVAARRLNEFLLEAGVSPERRPRLLEMYRFTKSMFRSEPVDFTYEAAGMRLGPFEMLHVPGHCAGHVVIRLHDVLFSGDHVLQGTSPHQSPEQITLSTGLDHYLRSLELVRPWAAGLRLTLGGHKQPILDLALRLDEIRALHEQRLQQVLNILQQPGTVAEVSRQLFQEVHGYNVLLALEEAGAHVEYLYQRGLLEIDNLAELEAAQTDAAVQPVAIRYRCLECQLALTERGGPNEKI